MEFANSDATNTNPSEIYARAEGTEIDPKTSTRTSDTPFFSSPTTLSRCKVLVETIIAQVKLKNEI
jgi:hypothetical protein